MVIQAGGQMIDRIRSGKYNIEIMYEDNHIIVVNKPSNIPTQEDSSKDIDLLNAIKLYLKDKYKKSGNVYLGLLHRLIGQ